MNPINLAQAIPVKIRQIVYSVIAALVGLEAVFDVIDDGWEAKILSALVVLGFGTALSNTASPPLAPPD